MKFFLKSKHWQLFIVVVGIPLIMQIIAFAIIISRMFSLALSHDKPDPLAMLGLMYTVVPVIMLVCLIIFFLWFYSLGLNLHRKLPSSVNMNLNLFLVFITYPVVYMAAFCFFIWRAIQITDTMLNVGFPTPILLIIPLHLFAMFCMFYCLYFVSKALKSVELKREALLGDYIVDFILFWFYFVGIWFLQPRINKVFAEDDAQLLPQDV
ncbi:hypothetical protein QEG73_24355 [Chitinophagaceae bacterium 26-R-25]|nr:hypothetical protein [Chitinophagaceae bacterium 26-R-25]